MPVHFVYFLRRPLNLPVEMAGRAREIEKGDRRESEGERDRGTPRVEPRDTPHDNDDDDNENVEDEDEE